MEHHILQFARKNLEHFCAIENVIGAACENVRVLLKASALQKYEAGTAADMRTWPSPVGTRILLGKLPGELAENMTKVKKV